MSVSVISHVLSRQELQRLQEIDQRQDRLQKHLDSLRDQRNENLAYLGAKFQRLFQVVHFMSQALQELRSQRQQLDAERTRSDSKQVLKVEK